jgi:ABC-type multidrug transport system fused ATPase/permease subunit
VLGLIYAYLARLYYPCGRTRARYAALSSTHSVSRDIRRLHALLRARLYSHLNETYTGISTIIAFGQQDRIVAEIDHLNNVEARAYLLQFPLRGCAHCWKRIRRY